MGMKGFALMAAAMLMSGGMGGPQYGHTPDRYKRKYKGEDRPFLVDPETPKGHIVEKINFNLEIGAFVYSGSISFTHVLGNVKSRNKRGGARLKELVEYLKSTPVNKIKEFKQFEVTPIIEPVQKQE